MLETLIYVATALLVIAIPAIYLLRERKKSARAAHTLAKAIERDMGEPVSLHPWIDPGQCIGTGACVEACPEVSVLGLIDNRGTLINPSRCIGHGQCQAACPVDAITLVFGTESRGVDIPAVRGNFETNVPGIFIAGELGGMGLIRNAVTQGREAAENVKASLTDRGRSDVLDLAIIGAGPAGISASLQALKDGLKFVTLDQDDLGGTVLTYPRRKLVMTQPMELPLYGKITARELAKEELLDIFQQVCARTGLQVASMRRVDDVQRVNGHYRVVTAAGEYAAQRVLLSIGRRGTPRKLDVPGEKSAKVMYRLLEPEQFTRAKILIVGGGDSAVEAAVALAEQPGNLVHVSYRREGFFRLKDGNQKRIDAAVKRGDVTPVFNSEVKRIEPATVILEQNGAELTLANDFVFVFAGGELPTAFLQKIGIEVTRKFGQR